jgi:capsular exopolysaccharide synthesis family protein
VGLTGTEVASKIDVQEQGQANVVSVTATDSSPEFAAKLANSLAQNYIGFRRNADRQKVAQARRLVEKDYAQLSPVDQQGKEGQSLKNQISKLQTLQALQTGNAELVQKADVPTAPSSPKTTRNTIVGAALGLVLGGVLALLFERLDRRLRDPGELEETFSLPVLAGVPNSKTLAGSRSPNGAIAPVDAEAFRMLRTRLRYFNVDRNIRSVLVTSPSAADGKTMVAWHLARSAAESGADAVLIEADFHRPTVAENRGLAPLPGLAELLSGQTSVDGVIQEVPLESRANGGEEPEHYLEVIVAGATPPNPSELLESEEMATLVNDLVTHGGYDLVVIDTPPMAMIADAIPLIKLVDGVIVVGQIGKTTRDEAVHLRNQLRELDAPVLGVVANRARSGRGYYGYYGTNGRGRLRGRRRRAVSRRA